MLNALMQLVGLAPRDKREVWHEKPLVVTDETGSVVFTGMATIEYTPGDESYEKGHAEVFDEENGEHVFSLEINGQRVYSTLNQANPFRVRWSRLGLTAVAQDQEGRKYKLYVGRHAHAFVLRGRTLDDGSADINEILSNADEPPVDGNE